jgi:DNA-binding transcriptional LysR family regulator
MVRFTLKQCSYFLAVAEHGGIAQAARSLNVSQPAIAQAMAKLEDLSGLRLFERHHARGVDLTAHGRAFAKHARDLVTGAEAMTQELRAIAAGHSGTVRFGCFHTLAPLYAARLVKGYRDLNPNVAVELCEALQDDLVDRLQSGELDVALMYDMDLDETVLTLQPVARLTPYIILPANHALAAASSISLHELRNTPYVMFDGAGSRDYFRALLGRHHIDPPVAFSSQSLETVRSAVGRGLGFSLLALRIPHDDTYDGLAVVCIEIAETVEPITMVLASKRGAIMPELVQSFTDHCSSTVRQAEDGRI